MKKTLTLAMVATLLMAGSAFAQYGKSHLVAAPNATFSFGVGGAAAGPATTNNNDACDIGVTPAATLLLPYFEVETSSRAVDTFLTIVNTSWLPQIAHVVVWTDYSYPVLDFNVFLTGFDVQPLSMYDIIVNGIIAPVPGSTTAGGTSSSPIATAGGVVLSPIGAFSNVNNLGNPNIPSLATCGTLPGTIPGPLLANIKSALINGTLPGLCAGAVGTSAAAGARASATTAIGYVTVDVAAVCSQNMPDAPAYYNSEILFDNTLTGDYEILNKAAGSNYAGGNPLVHIRAVPEGGPAATPLTGQQTNLPYTFYSRYINGVTNAIAGTTPTPANGLVNYDRRQPLPSTFAARWIQGGAAGFNTSYRIWREGRTGGTTGCGVSAAAPWVNAVANANMAVLDLVRFDEHENPAIAPSSPVSGPVTGPATFSFNETQTVSTAAAAFPQFPGGGSPAGDAGGWMYLNLDSGTTIANAVDGSPTNVNTVNTVLHPTWPVVAGVPIRASQNWVVVSMNGSGSTSGLFGVDFDGTWLRNGCTPVVAPSLNQRNPGIGPQPVCPAGDPGCTPGVGAYTGTNVTP